MYKIITIICHITNYGCERREITVCLSSEIVEEYIAVLLRPKFNLLGSPKERLEIISGLVELDNTLIAIPDFRIDAIHKDPDDNMFLECAIESKADIIISGDDHLLAIKNFKVYK